MIGAVLAAVVVLHAEPPADTPLAQLFAVTVRVEVAVDAEGSVTDVQFAGPRPPFVAAITEEAARKWRFAPSAADEPRRYVLTFDYSARGLTEKRSHREITRDGDGLTMRVRYLHSTIQWLERDAGGATPEQLCPRHQVPMLVGLVPLHYGLPMPNLSSDEHRDAYWRAAASEFPEANVHARNGGCTVGRETQAETYYCQLCREARAFWLTLHPPPADSDS